MQGREVGRRWREAGREGGREGGESSGAVEGFSCFEGRIDLISELEESEAMRSRQLDERDGRVVQIQRYMFSIRC